MSRVPNASAVESLMYAMVCTRPDLTYAVSTVSRFISNSKRQHWEAVKWVLRYLWGTARLLAQRPITLILMMINSCSYSLLMILCLISFRYLTKILVGVWLQQRSFGANTYWFKSSCVKIASNTRLSQARWIAFGSSRLGHKKNSVCLV